MKTKSKDPVRLRSRKMASGNTSLYLDIYVGGKRSYEYLHLYLIPETSRKDSERNRETMRLAETVRAQRLLDVQSGIFGFGGTCKPGTDFLDYFRRLCERRSRDGKQTGNWGNWRSTLRHLEGYCRPGTTFRDVTPEWVRGFKDYLDTATRVRQAHTRITTSYQDKPLSQNTKQSYFNKLRACMHQAVEDGIIIQSPLRGVENFKTEEKERVYLTLDEVKAMAAGECRYPVLKRAFLFSCLTGLRKSDIEKMRWSEVSRQGDYTRVIFRQKKTGGQEYLDISPQAVPYLGKKGQDGDLVFAGFRYSSYMLVELKAWALRSGVAKNITFHSARHTFAVLMLDLGADIYTVQKLLGHKEIHTTQVYAHILDRKKQEAVSLIPDIGVPRS